MGRNNLRSANGWQLWNRDDVGSSHKHLHRFDHHYLWRGHVLGWGSLHSLDQHLHGADGFRWFRRLHPADGGQLRRPDGMGWSCLQRPRNLHIADGLEWDNLRSPNSWQLWHRNDVGCSHKLLHRFDNHMRRGHDMGWDGLRSFHHHLRRANGLGRNNLRSPNSWQLWHRNDVGCSHKLLHRFDNHMRRGHDMGWDGLRSFHHHLRRHHRLLL